MNGNPFHEKGPIEWSWFWKFCLFLIILCTTLNLLKEMGII